MIFPMQFSQRLSFVSSGGSGQLSPGGAVKVQRVSERATEFKRLRPRTRLPLTSVIQEEGGEEEAEAEKKRRIINYLLLLLLQQFLVSVAAAAAAAKANFCANCSRKIQSQGESPTTTKVANEMKVICCCCCPQNTLRQHCAAQSAVHSGRHLANFRTHATFMECRRQQQRQRCPLRSAAICNFRWKIRRGKGNHCVCVSATCCARTCLQRRVCVCVFVSGDFNEFS